MRWRILYRVIAAVMLVGVAACGVGQGDVDGPLLTSPDGSGDGDDAEVKGVLTLDDGCILLVLEGLPYPVVWPAGTTWQDDPPAVILDGGEVVELRGSVYGGGGYYDRDTIAGSAGEEVADAAAECARVGYEIAMFNPGSTVEAG